MVESNISVPHMLRLVVMDVRVPKVDVCPPFIDMQDRVFPTYSKDACNRHHWKFEYVFDKVMPYIAKSLNIPFNPLDFIQVEESPSMYSHMVWHSDFKCTAYRLNTGKTEAFTYRECCNGKGVSKYHNVIRYPHESVLYTSASPTGSNRKLLVNADSMSIPLVPLMLPYYRQILFVDWRRKPTLSDIHTVEKFDCTDYLCLMIGGNYKVNAYTRNFEYDSTPPAVRSRASVSSAKPSKFNRRRSILAKLQSIRSRH